MILKNWAHATYEKLGDRFWFVRKIHTHIYICQCLDSLCTPRLSYRITYLTLQQLDVTESCRILIPTLCVSYSVME